MIARTGRRSMHFQPARLWNRRFALVLRGLRTSSCSDEQFAAAAAAAASTNACNGRTSTSIFRTSSGEHFSCATAAALTFLGASTGAAAVLYTGSLSSHDDELDSLVPDRPDRTSFFCRCEGRANTGTCLNEPSPRGAKPFRLNDVYEIEDVLGEGAYGTVHRARRKADGAVVALKTMPREFTGKSDFEREVAALQTLSKNDGHEHIVRLHDLHRDDDNYYLSMNYIEGGELLEHLIENGPYSEAIAASFLRQFAETLCFVHSNNLVHCDVKPENLLLSSNDLGKAKLILADFGCARAHDLGRKEMLLPAEEFAKGCSFLHMVALGNQFELEKRLQERPALVRFRDYDFRTPMHLAASEGHVDICRFLVSRGAPVNRIDRWGGSPLDDAHRHRHRDAISYLRDQGATFGTLTQLPRFIQSASEGDKAEVMALLEYGSVDIDKGDYDKRTALHLASAEGRAEIVELLLNAGADPNCEDRWGNRPIDEADNAKKHSTSIKKILIKFGARSAKNPSLDKQVVPDNEPYPTQAPGLHKGTKRSKDEAETSSGTMAYWSPELFLDGAMPTPASDLWASGVVMYIILTGTHPFDKFGCRSDEEIKDAVMKICSEKDIYDKNMKEYVFDERTDCLSESCVELMRCLLHPDPQQRMTSENFLRHPWIQGLTASWTTMTQTHDDLKSFWQNKFRAEIKKKFAISLDTSGEELTDDDLRKMFNALDLKKNDVLELDEIAEIFLDLGLNDKNIRTLFAAADLDGSGAISFDEFRALFKSQNVVDGPALQVDYLQRRFKSHIQRKFPNETNEAKCDENALRDVFNTIDLEGNGDLDPHDIRIVLRSVGEREDVISRIFASLDINRRGKVTYDDFVSIMMAPSD